MEEKKVTSRTVYESDFLTVSEDIVQLENGNRANRVYIEHIGAAAVLPITTDKRIILTSQFRYPIHSDSIEIPAGKKDAKNEPGIECARRELEEETAYRSDRFERIMDIHNCVGYSDEKIELYLARDCYLVDNPLSSDEDEFITVLEFSLDEVSEMIKNNTITDVKTIIAIQHYILHGSE